MHFDPNFLIAEFDLLNQSRVETNIIEVFRPSQFRTDIEEFIADNNCSGFVMDYQNQQNNAIDDIVHFTISREYNHNKTGSLFSK